MHRIRNFLFLAFAFTWGITGVGYLLGVRTTAHGGYVIIAALDGTGAGTQQVIPALAGNVNPIPNRRMAVMNNWLYFNGDFDASGAELWKVQ